jgi:hypothetical protein
MQHDEVSDSMPSGLSISSLTAKDWNRQKVWSRIQISRTWIASMFISSEKWWCLKRWCFSNAYIFVFSSSDGARGLGQNTWWVGMIFDRMKRRILWFSLRSRQERFFQPSCCSFSDVQGAKCLDVFFLATTAETLPNTSCCCDHLCRGPHLDQSQPYLVC